MGKEYYPAANINIKLRGEVAPQVVDGHYLPGKNSIYIKIRKLIGASAPHTAESLFRIYNALNPSITKEEIEKALDRAEKNPLVPLYTKKAYLTMTKGEDFAESAEKIESLTAEVEALREEKKAKSEEKKPAPKFTEDKKEKKEK